MRAAASGPLEDRERLPVLAPDVDDVVVLEIDLARHRRTSLSSMVEIRPSAAQTA